jgi:hypothetical protein
MAALSRTLSRRAIIFFLKTVASTRLFLLVIFQIGDRARLAGY